MVVFNCSALFIP